MAPIWSMNSSSIGRLASRPSSRRLRSKSTASYSPRKSLSLRPALPQYALSHTYTSPSTPCRTFHTSIPHRLNLPPLSSLLSFAKNNNSNASSTSNHNGTARTLTATRTLPYGLQPLFNVISSVEAYSQFLPFLVASTVTARDPQTALPTRAILTVGYGPLRETFTSRVECNPQRWIVEARSGAKDCETGACVPSADEGIFEYLSTRWKLDPLDRDGDGMTGRQPRTRVELEIKFAFRSQLHAAMMSAVEGQMAGLMIEAFEKRIREIEGEP